MIEVIYREDVSEDSIHEPRNVKQIGSVDPKYRIYMEDTVLTCIRKNSVAENEVHFGLLLGELKRAAGTTYLFIRGMAKAGRKQDASRRDGEKRKVYGTGSGAVALERLTLDRQRGAEAHKKEEEFPPDSRKEGTDLDGNAAVARQGVDGDATADRQGLDGGAIPDKQNVDTWDDSHRSETTYEDEKSGSAAGAPIEFDDETWTRLYEDINRWFPDMEILGWYASFPFLNVAEFDLCRENHYTHFSGADKVLFLCDRIEREENFYRPDGADLRETEGYFTFFEKNDAMCAYQQENESQDESATTPGAEEEQRSLRHGTVGEAPRRKWNISAASVLLTAALFMAVFFVNRYNSRLKAGNTGAVGGTVEGETSSVQTLAVDGQVMDPAADSEGADDEKASGGDTGDGNGELTGEESESGGAAGEGSEAGGETGEGSASGEAAGEGSASGETAGEGNEFGGVAGEGSASGGTAGEGSASGGTAGEGNADSSGVAEAGTAGNNSGGNSASDGSGSANGDGSSEGETVQTGSRVSARYYTVKNGETLYSICMDVYKTSAMVEIVRVLNGIGEDYVIQEGQKILLP